MTTLQQGDINLFQTDDDGEIFVENGLVGMSGGLETAAYLSLFGGNEDDDGRKNNPLTWWGNLDEEEAANEYRSETQNLISSIPATSGNLLRIEDAARRDLEWFLTEKIASVITVVASIPAVNRIQLEISINAVGLEVNFEFVENWMINT
jgi:phage gp46-like protein